jgi:hypothetical protein
MRTKQILSLIVMAAYLGGCTSWRVQPVSPQQLVETERPGKVRVLTTSQEKLVFKEPFVRDDSLMGYVDGRATRIPLEQITKVEKKQTDAAKIGVLTIAIVGIIALAATADYMGDFRIDWSGGQQ